MGLKENNEIILAEKVKVEKKLKELNESVAPVNVQKAKISDDFNRFILERQKYFFYTDQNGVKYFIKVRLVDPTENRAYVTVSMVLAQGYGIFTDSETLDRVIQNTPIEEHEYTEIEERALCSLDLMKKAGLIMPTANKIEHAISSALKIVKH